MANITEHPVYKQTVSQLERTAVRDKLMRLIQYFSRFLSYYLYRKGFSKEAVLRAKTITSQLSVSRKLFRIGKPLGPFRAFIAELSNQTSDRVIHLTTLGRNFGTAAYLVMDSLVWLNKSGVYKFKPENFAPVSAFANRFWLLSLLSGLIQGAYLYYKADAKQRALSQEKEKDADSFKLVAVEKHKAAKQVLVSGLDALIPATGLGYLNLDDGVLGIAGTITAWIGLQALL